LMAWVGIPSGNTGSMHRCRDCREAKKKKKGWLARDRVGQASLFKINSKYI
jgi:hypothetical protein